MSEFSLQLLVIPEKTLLGLDIELVFVEVPLSLGYWHFAFQSMTSTVPPKESQNPTIRIAPVTLDLSQRMFTIVSIYKLTSKQTNIKLLHT